MAGEKVISGDLRLKIDGKTIFHATSCSLSMARELKERATKDTNGVENAKGRKTWSATADALGVYKSDGVLTHDFKALFDIYNDDADTALAVEFLPDEVGGIGSQVFKYTGTGILTALDGTFENDADATISLTVTGSGVITAAEVV